MRKYYWTVTLLILVLSAVLLVNVTASNAVDDGLSMIAPTTCPSTGCAAGQRLNFRVQFPISPQSPNPNTQVCIYAPAEGQSADAASPWATFDQGWISTKGLISGESYTQGQVDSLCTDNQDEEEEWLTGAYASLTSGSTDQLDFALHIHTEANVDGYIKVKIFASTSENVNWLESATYIENMTVVELNELVFVAQDPIDCGTNQPCFVNSGDDLEEGIGTGLRDAVSAIDSEKEIRILKDYTIKDHAVLVDKELLIQGHQNAMITYIGTECGNPMLLITNGGTLRKLTINDGNCISPSRNLIEVNSPTDVAIEENTLVFGKHAVYVEDNAGDVTVAFNHISNNDDYAVFRAEGKSTGSINIFANNILNNRPGYQVNCNNQGVSNHNFWGEGLSATANAVSCTITNGKRLGAPIRFASDQPGVQAQRLTVTSQMTYAFDEKIGAQRTQGDNFEIIIVNHGQGSEVNIPFYQEGTGDLQACSNYYDIFLAEDAAATNLILAFKYDLNSNCVSTVESNDFCGGSDSQKYPLWWYDPATNATDGWDRTGQNPQGIGAGGASGQETTCHPNLKEIRVNVDNTGRPSISSDLNFTPFVVGLPIIDGITLSQFTAQFDGSRVNLRWVTSSEINVKGFYVLRAETSNGTYARISSLIEAIGDKHIGGIYQYADSTITFSKNYYYKIEVIDKDDNSIATHGPVSIFTATATPTATLTRTPTTIPTATRTRTPFFYNSPTPYYRPRTSTPFFRTSTATPSGGPTQIRTYGPTPTGSLTVFPYPTDDYDPESGYPSPDPGYPPGLDQTPPIEGYPLPSTPSPTEPTPTPSPEPDVDEDTPAPGTDDGDLPAQDVRWIFILVGVAGGLSLIGAASVILAGTRFS